MLKRNVFGGIILIVIGALFMLNNIYHLHIIQMEYLWPFFILLPGLAFEFGYFFSRFNPGILVPGGIFTTIGLLFFFEVLTDWRFAEYTWPIYPLAVAIGLFQLYLFSGKKNGLLVPVFILGGISLLSFIAMFLGSILSWINVGWAFPILLILIGVFLILKK